MSVFVRWTLLCFYIVNDSMDYEAARVATWAAIKKLLHKKTWHARMWHFLDLDGRTQIGWAERRRFTCGLCYCRYCDSQFYLSDGVCRVASLKLDGSGYVGPANS